MPLPRPCECCSKRFQPNGKYQRLCLECYKIKTRRRFRSMKNTYEERKSLKIERECK